MQAVPFLIITHYNVFSYIYQRLFVLLSQFFLVSAFLHLAQCARNKALCFFVPNSRYGFNCLRFTRLLVRIYSLHIVLQEKSSITWPPLQKSLWYRKNRIHPPIPWTSPGKSLPMSVPLCRPRQIPGPAFCTLFRIHVMPGSKAWSTCPLSSPPFFHYDHTAFFLVFFQTFPLQVTFIRLINDVQQYLG